MREIEYWVVTFDDLTCIYHTREAMFKLIDRDAGGRQNGRISRMLVSRP